MSLFKISALIIVYFISRAALATTCETWTGINSSRKLCWDPTIKAWISSHCQENCEAKKFLESKLQSKKPASLKGQNRAADACHRLELPVVVLKDSNGNEQAFCELKDRTLVSATAIEEKL
jgi:hypothetical protein